MELRSGCPRLWPAPSARPARGRARDPASSWAQLGPPLTEAKGALPRRLGLGALRRTSAGSARLLAQAGLGSGRPVPRVRRVAFKSFLFGGFPFVRDWCPEALASGMVVDWPATRNRRESRDGLRVTEAETLEGPENPGKWQPATCIPTLQGSVAAALSLSAGPASEASAGDHAHCPCPMT
jgi:hypothetical protein